MRIIISAIALIALIATAAEMENFDLAIGMVAIAGGVFAFLVFSILRKLG